LQTGLKVLREGEQGGLLIHGMGRLGKSSPAARIAHRRPDLEPVVIFQDYDALSIVQAIHDACRKTEPVIEQRQAALRDAPEALEGLLVELLEGPCAQTTADGGKPMLLVIDDLERILEEPGAAGQRWRVKADHVTVLTAVIKAFARARTDSRLVLTSRYTFTLPDSTGDLGERLYPLQPSPMDPASARRQAQRREQQAETKEPDDEPAILQRWRLIERAVNVAHGNPGLQDLLYDLVLSDTGAADGALSEMEAYLEGGDLPDDAGVQAFLLNLALDRPVDLAGPDGKELLRRATLFRPPVPQDVLAELSEQGPDVVERLLGLGLLDRFEDLVDPAAPALAVNALVAPRVGEVEEGEEKALTARILEPLYAAWGGDDGKKRPYPADLELCRLALLTSHLPVIKACAPPSIDFLDRQFAYRQAAELGLRAVAACDAGGGPPPVGLLRRTGEACVTVGEVKWARELFGRGLSAIENAADEDETPDRFEHSTLVLAQARLLVQSGSPDAAMPLLEQARKVAQETGNEISAAVTLGDIARLRAARGEVDEALRLQNERLAVNKDLGDLDGQTAASWDIAEIELARQNYEAAIPMIAEAYRIFDQTGRLEGISAIGAVYGQILVANDRRDEGLAVLRRSAQGFRQLSRPADAEAAEAVIRQIEEIDE